MAASSKRFGEGRVRFGSDVADIDRISWGSLELDMATWGGAPMGRVIRPWGGKHTAKSLITWGLVKSAQEFRSDKYPDGLTCVYFNAEGQYDPHFTKEFMGVDTDKLVVEEGSIIEEITSKAAAYLDVAHILIIDSIGHCQSRAQYELDPAKGATKGARGTQAVAWGQFLKHVIERMDKHENMIVAIDQVRTNQTYGQEIASGSNIWDHCSSMDLHHRKIANLYKQADGTLGPDRPQKPHYQTMGQEVLIDGFEIGIEVNKCVTGETEVHTNDGLRLARDLAGREVMTLSEGGVYRPAKWFSGGAAPIYRVVLKTGDEIFATGNHEWVTSYRHHGIRQKCLTVDLVGKSIPIQPIKDFSYDEEEYAEGVRHGMTYGDGTLYKSSSMKGSKARLIQFTSEDREVMDRFFSEPREGAHYSARTTPREIKHGATDLMAYTVSSLPAKWKSLPALGSSQSYLRGFIAGLLEADGHFNKKGGIYIYQSSKESLKTIRKIAQEAGISCGSIYEMKRNAGAAIVGSGGIVGNIVKEGVWYSLSFGKKSFFGSDGSVDERMVLKSNHKKNLITSGPSRNDLYTQVVSVEPTGRVEEVFCCDEPETHTWVIGNGILTGNSRVCRPFGKYRGRLDFYDMQWDRNFELKKVALYLGVVTQSGAYFSIDGESKSMHGHKQFDQRLNEDPSLVMKIYGAVDKYFKENGYGKNQ